MSGRPVSPERRAVRLLAAAVALTALVAACGDSGGEGSTGTGRVVFGEGELPATVPSDFPIPAGAVIGTTLVDGINIRTEAEMRVPSEIDVVAQFFSVGFVNNGYVVGDNSNDGTRWRIEFRRNGVDGEVVLTPAGSGVTQVVVVVNDA